MALTDRLSALNGLYSQHIRTQPRIAAATVAVAIGLVPLLRYAVSSYRGYMALGKGGIPHNVFGWLMQEAMRPLARGDRANPAPYRDPKVVADFPPMAGRSFLAGPLPQRAGGVPDVPNYVVPQRQMTEQGTPAMNARMTAFLDSLAGANPDVYEVRPSHLEGVGTPAIHLRQPGQSALMGKTRVRGETVHIHHESSSHMTLSLKDAEEAVTKGWGERHPFSGRASVLPWTYLMIYAPRDDAEFEVWKSLVQASCAFFSGGKKVEA